MNLSDIEEIAIIVQINGNAHQVLASKENKELMLTMLAQMDSTGLRIPKEMEPVKFVFKK